MSLLGTKSVAQKLAIMMVLLFLTTGCSKKKRSTTTKTTPNSTILLSASELSLAEGESGSVTVELNKAPSADLEIIYTIDEDTAASEDYSSTSGTITIPAGSTTGTFELQSVEDEIYEGDEQFKVSFSSEGSVVSGTSEIFVAIVDNEEAPTVEFSAESSAASENAGTASVELTLSALTSKPVVLAYSITAGSASGGGSDHSLPTTGTVTIPAGETSANLVIPVVNDRIREAVETIEVTLQSANNNIVLGTKLVHTFSIVDNDVPDVAHSVITATGPVIADGVAASTITITLKNADDEPLEGVSVSVSASGTSNNQGACSPTSSQGVATCTLKSTKAEVKSVSLTQPSEVAAVSAATTTFTAGAASALNSTIAGDTNVAADGTAISNVVITLKDAFNNPVSGASVNFASTGTGNTLSLCPASTNAAGSATCALTSTTAEDKTISISAPSGLSSVTNTVKFVSPVSTADPTKSSIAATGPIDADGQAYSVVTITLRDSSNAPVVGEAANFSASGTGNTKDSCSLTNASGLSTCKLYSTVAEAKTLAITTPSNAGFSSVTTSVTFNQVPSTTGSSIVCTPTVVVANNSSTTSCTATIKDYANTAMANTAVVIAATGTGNTLTSCTGNTDASGVLSGCLLKSSSTGTKTISISTPSSLSSKTTQVEFTAPDVSVANSSISCAGTAVANGVAYTTCTITVKDGGNVAMSGVSAAFGGTNVTVSNCSGATTDSNGEITCRVKSTVVGEKTVAYTSPAQLTVKSTTVQFTAQVISEGNSGIDCNGTPVANGYQSATCTITLRDSDAQAISGQSATMKVVAGDSTTITGCTPATTGADGKISCAVKSTKVGTKTIGIETPVSLIAKTKDVYFSAQVINATNSSFSCTPASPTSRNADNSAYFTCTITVKDSDNQAIDATPASFVVTSGASSGASASSNTTIFNCSAANTNSSGTKSCDVKSTKGEVKTLTVSTPSALTAKTAQVTFVSVPSKDNSTIACTPDPAVNDGTAASTCTITIREYNSDPMSGVSVYITSTGTNNTIASACTSSTPASTASPSGSTSACTIKSTTAESKTITLIVVGTTWSPAKTTTVTFAPPAVLSMTRSSTSYDLEGNYLFGRYNTGTTSSLSFTVKNSGGIAATVTQDAAGLAAPYTFTGGSYPGTGGTCGSSIASGASCTVNVSFAPTSTGTFWDQIALGYNDGSASRTLNSNYLYGTGSGERRMTVASPTANAKFGSAVAVAGPVAIVGTPGPTDTGAGSATVYRYRKSGGSSTWVKESDLTSSLVAGGAGDQFGFSVDISGDYAIVGVPYDDDSYATNQGTARIFQYDGSSWTETVKLAQTCSGSYADDNFGFSVAIDGMKAIVGTPYDNWTTSDRGSATAFVFDGTTWQKTCIEQSGVATNSYFGYSVDISGDIAVVGAPGQDLAYVYKYAGGTTWTMIQTLVGSDTTTGDFFGASVSIKGDVIAVGAPSKTVNSLGNAGTAYIFRRVRRTLGLGGSEWYFVQEHKVTNAAAANVKVGQSVSVSDDAVAIAAPGTFSFLGATVLGQVNIIRFQASSNDSWSQTWAYSASDSKSFTGPVALSGTTLFVGDSDDTVSSNVNAGSVLVYNNVDNYLCADWSCVINTHPAETLLQANEAANGGVSGEVAISNSVAAATTYSSSTPGVNVYSYSGNDWSLEQKLTDNTYSTFASGGIALWNNYLIVGNKDEDNGATVDAGSFSIFKKSSNAGGGTTLSAWQKVAGGFPFSGANYKMGAYVAIYGDVAVVAGGGASVLVIYRRGASDTWTAEKTITLTLGARTITSVALYGHFLAIGSYYGIVPYVDIYKYDTSATPDWVIYQTITGANSSGFGSSVAMTDGLLIVSASTTKEVKIYRNKGSTTKFAIEATLTRPTGEDGDFGADVAINQGMALVGVPGGTGSTAANNKGHAYLYTYVKGTGWKTGTDAEVPVKEITFNPSYSGKNYFGASVGLSESMAIIGVGNQSGTEFNKAYIYSIGP